MKKILHLLALCLAGSTSLPAQDPQVMHGDQHNTLNGPGGQTLLFANDVAIMPGYLRQHGTSIAVAFNGWLYEATGLETTDSDSSGGIIRMSRDNGYTWTTFASYLYPNVDYLAPEIEVAGTDTNSLVLFIASAWFDSTSMAADVWVDKYQGNTGAFITEVYNESFPNAVRDIDIASDYRYPAWNSLPYSVGLLYSHFGTTDSLIFVSSGDGGTTWGNRKGVAGTAAYMDQVSLAYGVTGLWSNGRYFAAWEERSSFTGTAIGKIRTAHCVSVFNGAWTSPISLDSLDPAISGVARRPRIACQYNSVSNNDSSGISTVVVFERAYGGDTADCDIIGFYSLSQPFTNNWYRFDVVNNSTQTLQPDVSYDPTYNNFLLTYFDRSQQRLPYLVHEHNMITPASWAVITTNYCDQPALLRDPFPRVTINPALTQAAFSWTNIGAQNREQAMFDAEYLITTVPEAEENAFAMSVYPNPAQDQAALSFELASSQSVSIDVYSATGARVMNVINQTMNEGPQRVWIPVGELTDGIYYVTITAGGNRQTLPLMVAH